MQVDNSCIFCKIVNKELSAHIIYETKNVLAFLDIHPINPGHTLVIIKPHYTLLDDIPKKYFITLLSTVQKVGIAIKKGLNVTAYNIIVNNGKLAGQLIPHLHFHIVPRTIEDKLSFHPVGKTLTDIEFVNIKDKIKGNLK